ncbi:MAG: hypothetical protein KC619_33355 [Myxococcales bacterium]|nr:hypothetical protein [Myxococcales bacterium]
MSRTASLALIGLALTGCLGTSPTAPPDEVVAGDGVFEGHRPVELGGAALRARAVSGLRVIVDDDAVPFTPARIPSTLRLNLFGDAIHDAVLTDATTHRGTVLWHGEVVGQVGSLVSLAFYDGAVAGTVRVGPRVFAIRPRPGGAVIVEEDDAAVPEGGPPVVPRIDDPEPPMAGDGTPAAAGDAVAEIDILVVYTSAARAGAGDAGIRATIELAVDEANQSFVTSGVPAHFNLLDAVETRYDETDLDYSTTLSRLSNTTDGYLDDVPPLREALGADHVVLLVDHVGSYSGLGYQMTSDNRGSFSRFAYAVVARDYAAGYYTLAHEVGHNMGATHDAAHADQEGFYADSHGHQVPDAGYRTIMAYACTTGSCPRTSVWSSPTLVHEGRPTGVAGVSDNVRTLQTTASITAAFRARPAPVAVAAAIVRPTDGASLTGTTATFEWNDVGADEHLLFVGRAPGDDAFFGGSVGAATTAVVRNLPSTGERVYVRLFSRFGDTELSTDASFVAYRTIEPRARLIFPDRQLPGSWSFFAWHEVDAALEYRLEVGTLTEPARYHSSSTGDTFSFVAGLPADGREVIARLHTRGPSGWSTFAAIHRTWTAPEWAATITAPVSGDTLPGRQAVFRWTDSGARAHWLVVEDETGIVAAVSSEDTRARVTGLPIDGRQVWVALYSLGPTGWVSTSASYHAASR